MPPSPSSSSGVVILFAGILLGISIWILTRPKPQPRHYKKPEPDKPLEKIYEKVTPTPLPDPAVKVIPPKSFYTQDHYDGPMGVPVPLGLLADYPDYPYPRYPRPMGFVGSTYDGPAPEVITPWVKLAVLVRKDDGSDQNLLDLYGREIAPGQDLYQYEVRDLNGFSIPLHRTDYIESDDLISDIPGKPGVWKVVSPKRWVWV